MRLISWTLRSGSEHFISDDTLTITELAACNFFISSFGYFIMVFQAVTVFAPKKAQTKVQ